MAVKWFDWAVRGTWVRKHSQWATLFSIFSTIQEKKIAIPFWQNFSEAI